MIETKIGYSRTAPYTEADRIAPAGTIVPSPFDIQHGFRPPVGRSSGGALVLADYERITWMYSSGVETLYTIFMAYYDPTNPFVWIQFYDVYDDDAAWWEATMQEPKVTRGVGATIQNLSITFTHLWKVP